ncbi:MAG: glycosyltransferase family 4 protein [Kiritimatiellae bacterium]|nr:glycosyltransferase family 4 protein [Kiritimatiellia bacterium]
MARRDAGREPVPGITIVGDILGTCSNAHTCRDLAHALKAAGVPFQTFPTWPKPSIPEEDYRGILTPESEFRPNRYSHVIEMFRSPLPRDLVKVRARVAFWEGEHGMLQVWPFLRGTDPIVAMSDFNFEYFKKDVKDAPVFKILYPLQNVPENLPSRDEMRAKFKIGKEDFMVFYNFDFGSYFRKNPQAAIRAFARAFKDVSDAKLVFKTMGAKKHPDLVAELLSLARRLGVSDRFDIVVDYLSVRDVYGLTAAADVYLSLHRGEGFGIGMAEAMQLGVPVVATDWSANTEFCVPGASCPVPYKLVPVRSNEYFTAMKEWAEADVDAAAKSLRALHDDSAFRARIGAAGKAFVEDHFSIANFRKSVDAFLDG